MDLQLFATPEEEGRTEEPTQRKLQRARTRGYVARTLELSPAIVTLATCILFLFIGAWLFSSLFQFLHTSIEKISPKDFSGRFLYLSIISMGMDFLKIVIPIMACAFFFSLLSEFLQVGLNFSYQALAFDLSKVWFNFGRIWRVIIPSIRALVEYGKAIFKVTIIAYFAWTTIVSNYPKIIFTMSTDVFLSFFLMCKLSFEIMLKSAIFLAIMSLLDYLYQRHEYRSSLKMTRYELKDEWKQMEGDPLMKAKIRERQRQMAGKRMMEEVRKADVIITNPVSIAIALKYDTSFMSAPMVIAKGMSIIAENIVGIAKEHNIPIVPNKPLAQALYRAIGIGEEITVEFYEAVAEVLTFVWKLKRR